MADAELSKLKKSDKNAETSGLTTADASNLGTLLGSWKTDLALRALKGVTGKLLETALPKLLFCIEPEREPDPNKFLAQARKLFDNRGEAVSLARKKFNAQDLEQRGVIKDFTKKFSSLDNAKLLAYWRFPKANDLKDGKFESKDSDSEEAFCLLFRKGLDADDRKNLNKSDLERLLGKRAQVSLDDAKEGAKEEARLRAELPLTATEEARLKSLMAKIPVKDS